MNPGFGIYVHWPYCARICPYCDFNVYKTRGDDEALLEAIREDLEGHAARMAPQQADTLFLGGGTPSLLSPTAIAGIIEAANDTFGLAEDAEITLEANPEDAHRFKALVKAGVTRLSIGVQSLNDADLKALGRTHDAAAAKRAVEIAADAEARVSLDLIYAREHQTLSDWERELREALTLPAEHLSLYQLTIEPGTAFDRAVQRGALHPPANEDAARFYELTQQITQADAPAYEVSNHARSEAAQSKHNLIYWRGGDWLGIGPGAHGRISLGERIATAAHRRPEAYINAVREEGVGWDSRETLDDEMSAEEWTMMGLRLAEGVDRQRIERALGRTFSDERLAAFASEGLLQADAKRITLTARGRLLTDRIASDLLT